MNIVTIGRGNIGGGLARLWTQAGHDVTTLGHDGGDASGADVIVVAVPAGAISEALAGVSGIDGKVTLDATNRFSRAPDGFASLAAQVRSIVSGPTAKCFNLCFAALFDNVAEERIPPDHLFAADPDARATAEQLVSDAGYRPLFAGDIDSAAALLEDAVRLPLHLAGTGLGPHFYRYSRPGEL
jgi:predicted dinucleotide-binding enzyme